MNKFLAVLGILVLVGAGCASNVETKVDLKTPSPTPEQAAQNEEATESAAEAEAEAETEAKTDASATGTVETTIKTEDGAEIVLKTEGEADVETGDAGVIDIVLGADVDQTINMEVGNFFFKPNVINAKAGERIKLVFTKNAGFHTFVIDETGLSLPIAEGESGIFTAPKAGTYQFYCDIGSHKSMGMVGTLIVK